MPTSDLSSEPTRASLADVTPAIALGPLDGRYRSTVAPLVDHLSEAALNRERLHVEVEWLVALTDGTADGPVVPGAPRLSEPEKAYLRDVVTTFSGDGIAEMAEIERETVHDVKAVEYFLKRRLAAAPAAVAGSQPLRPASWPAR